MNYGGDSGDEFVEEDNYEFVKDGYEDSEDEGAGNVQDSSWCVCVCIYICVCVCVLLRLY
jgi:hypothetical protein